MCMCMCMCLRVHVHVREHVRECVRERMRVHVCSCGVGSVVISPRSLKYWLHLACVHMYVFIVFMWLMLPISE